MKVVLLTTETTHHTYFAWKVHELFHFAAIFLETRTLVPPFDTFHPFEAQRNAFERDILLAGFSSKLSDLSEPHTFEDLNDPQCFSILKALAPEVVIVFGTGRLRPPIIQVASTACLNLHGGNPEEYRGLDTHLWAIFHRDFNNLVTTLHYVDNDLDTGAIVYQSQLRLKKDVPLYKLRSINTEVCVNLTIQALASLQSNDWLPSRKQVRLGRYYSFMPAVLKEDCLKKFNRYVAEL